jgi:repressor LexA
MRKALTARQQDILDFVAATIARRGAPPTLREIMEEFSINSTNGVRTTLAALERKGYIRRRARLSRGIELVDHVSPELLTAELCEIPLLGRVAAGEPILAEQNVETTLRLDRALVPTSGTVFALRVRGDSMTGAGILDGDVVLARQQEDAERGDIVVALLGEDATVKRFAPEPDCIRLLPANDAYEPIVVAQGTDGFRIAGKVVGLVRHY